ncbi:ketopantoate reductase family protein [Salinibacterium hongtaonis]|uniref:2-dehydropantoate 2-reductase n=1 Tax=Homoserinimonas hongtaonis TaxID=2079791 RepID=A0A2U1SXA2_9MICO|nr:ketopantoate reductase family protein [Salinibacterium hongtaonis]PWB96265.1 2-dehydropantoate 2-reductase [Salinibacterium hongtaonis]
MRIAVLGAGAIGGTIAALLDRAGHDVHVTARGETLAAIREHGIQLKGAWGEHTARVTATHTLDAAPELAILTTKAMDGAAAVTANLDALKGVPLVVVQNGLGGIEEVTELMPGRAVVGALALFAASWVSPGVVTVTAPAGTWLGMATEGDDSPARAAAEVLAPALPVSVVDNFVGARWTKLVINQVNAIPAITGLSVQEVISDTALRRVMVRGMREAVRVGRAKGIHFGTVNGLSHSTLLLVAWGPLWAGEVVALRLRAYLGDVPNPGSTLQSIRRGQPTEIDYLTGAVVAQSAGTGVQTPVNALLTELVHEVERTGKFLPPETVISRAQA